MQLKVEAAAKLFQCEKETPRSNHWVLRALYRKEEKQKGTLNCSTIRT